MDSPEHEILDLTAIDENTVDDSAVEVENSSNFYEIKVSPNLIGTIRFIATPVHPGPVVRSVYSMF